MPVYLSALQTVVPQFRYSQSDILSFMLKCAPDDTLIKRSLTSIYHHSGIGYRHSVLADFDHEQAGLFDSVSAPTTASRMGLYTPKAKELSGMLVNQIANALEYENRNLAEITHLVWVSCTGLISPGLETVTAQDTRFAPNVQTTAFNFLGCHGFFHALRFARNAVQADAKAKVLIICLELCTLHFQNRWHTDQILANAIFGDGAAGLVVSSEPMTQKALEIKGQKQFQFPDSAEAMAWSVGDSGFDMRLSQDLPNSLEQIANQTVESALMAFGHHRNEILYWLFHPGGKRILDRLQAALNLLPDDLAASRKALEMVGNVSSASILFALEAFFDLNQPKPDPEIGIMLGVGPGLVLETALFRF